MIMNDKSQEWIRTLETEWSTPEGFLGKAREGTFDKRQADAFVTTLESIKLSGESTIDRRLVALLWYVPGFLRWRKERIAEKGGDIIAFEQLINRVQGVIEDILGVP
jgi:hypothetical protein